MREQLYQTIEDQLSPFNARAVDLLKTTFAPLEKIDPQLAQHTLLFILKAEHIDVLLQLQQRSDDKACLLLAKPGTFHWYHSATDLSKEEEKLAKQSLKSRRELYQDIFNLLDHAQIIRYSKILSAACQEYNLSRLYPALPDWFHFLVIDSLITVFSDVRFSERDHRKGCKKHWSMAKLEQLLEQDQAGQGQFLLGMLFERQNLSYFYTDYLEQIFELSDTHDYVQSKLQRLGELLPQMSIEAQIRCIDYLSQHVDYIQALAAELTQLSVSSSKKVRDAATPMLVHFEEQQKFQLLKAILIDGSSVQRRYAADMIARFSQASDDLAQNIAVLEQAHAAETQKSVQSSILTALQRLKSMQPQSADTTLTLPAFTPIVETFIPESFTETILSNYQAVLLKTQQQAADETEKNKEQSYKSTWANNNLKKLQAVRETQLKQLVAFLNGSAQVKRFQHLEQVVSYQNRLQNLEEYSIIHALRLSKTRNGDYIHWGSLFEHLQPSHYADLELRHYADLLQRSGYENPNRLVAKSILQGDWNSLADYVQDGEKLWPFFADKLEFISEALGLSPNLERNQYQSFSPRHAIKILQHFPSMPQQFIPCLLELALGEQKSLRLQAQNALEQVENIHLRAIEALDSGKQEIRITAIEWLIRLKHPDALVALNTLLKKEKKEVVRATLLTALEQFGQDISAFLSPKVLLAEAEKGLKARLPASLSWFDFSLIPQLNWQNGKALDPRIVQWWIILAEKLKEPQANPLLQRYLALLDPHSQVQFSNFILQSFIHQDTRGPTIEEATALAVQQAPSRLQDYQDWYKRYPEYYAEHANATLESVAEELKRQHLATYLGSAIKSKGMLALCFFAQGHFAVKLLQDYLKQHYQRRAQIEAMIRALSMSNDPLIIQLLLGLSRRYRTSSVQYLAQELVAEIAERNHWSPDELADRTIPTAGLNEHGILELNYGSRFFTAYVDAKDKFILKTDEGKIIKALPAARQSDDQALIKECKALFSSSKKEFKQVVELQSARLYEAMCSQRQWPVAEWQSFIYNHPIMRRLIQNLVWVEILANGEQQQFRPSDDGCLLNLDDDEIELATDSQIQIAHGVVIGAEDAEAWLAHFKDYKLNFLFAQMSHFPPVLDLKHATEIDDRKGWLTDTFTLRGVVNKMGYQRAQIEDAGSFDCYTKKFDQLGINVHIEFSGSYVPEENLTAVLYGLSFESQQHRSWNRVAMPLDQVPPILLAESYAEYLKLAEACSGFDPEWQKKTPW